MINRLKSSRLFLDSFWSLLGNVIGKGLALLSGIFVARILGKEVFGEYSVIRNTILTIGMFSTFGLGYTSTKFVADFIRDNSKDIRILIKYITQATFCFSLFVGGILFCFAYYISTHFLNDASLAQPLQYLAFLIVFNAITVSQIGILSGLKEFKSLAVVNCVIGAITFFTSVIFTYYWGFNGALLSLIASQVINCICNEIVIRRKLSQTPIQSTATDKLLIKKVLLFSFPIALQEFIFAATSWLSMLLLVRYSGYGELGMYNAAMQWNAIVLFIPGILRNVILAHLSSNTQNKMEYENIIRKTVVINIICTIIPSVLVFFFSSYINQMYGKTFAGLDSLISMAVFSTVFLSIGNVYTQAFTSIGKNWLMLCFRFFRDISSLILFVILITYFHINGASAMLIGTLSSGAFFVIYTVITFYMVKNRVTTYT